MTDKQIEKIILKIKSDSDKETVAFIKKLLKKYKLTQDELIKALTVSLVSAQNEDGTYTVNLGLIRKNIIDTFNGLNETQNAMITELLNDVYKEIYKSTATKLNFAIDFSLLRKEFIAAAVNAPIDGKRYSDRIWTNTDELANRIYNDVLQAIQKGKSPEKIARQIRKDYGVSAYKAKRLINTEVARVQAAAAMEVYRNSGVVNRVRWCATLEENTCDTCAGYDGKEFLLDNAPAIPVHPNCRCCYLPVIDGYNPTVRVTNDRSTYRKGQTNTIDYVNYGQWANNR